MSRIVATGCGRAGTQFLARLLTCLGLRCGHERLYSYDLDPDDPKDQQTQRDRWGDREGDVSWLAVPWLDRLPLGTAVWHQLRDPRKVVECWTQHHILGMVNGAARYVHKFLPQTETGPPLERAVLYVLAWNKRAEQTAAGHLYLRYRVEDLTPLKLCGMLALSGFSRTAEQCAAAFEQTGTRVGACQDAHVPVTWEQIRAVEYGPELADLAARYGY